MDAGRGFLFCDNCQKECNFYTTHEYDVCCECQCCHPIYLHSLVNDIKICNQANNSALAHRSKNLRRRYERGVVDNPIPKYLQKAVYGSRRESCNYQRKYHFNERIANFTETDPGVPEDINTILEARHLERYITGKAPELCFLWKDDIQSICKELGFTKYSERWKRILRYITMKRINKPNYEILDYLVHVFQGLQIPWDMHKNQLPSSRIKTRDGTIITKARKSISHLNIIMRKILECHPKTINKYHMEFPTLKTPKKIILLDNILAKCFEYLWIPYRYTIIFKYQNEEDGKQLRRKRTQNCVINVRPRKFVRGGI